MKIHDSSSSSGRRLFAGTSYNEERNLKPLLKELERTMAQSACSHEIICVDDGSQDSSLQILQKMQQTRDNFQILRHTRNYGQSAAFASGFQVARSPVIITMDADLQHDPADIPRLLQARPWCAGVRANRRDTWIKRFSSQTANAFRNRVVDDRITDAGCTFLAMRREALENLGCAVLPASTSREALALAQEHTGRIDLLVTDVIMPEMNGKDLAEQLSFLLPDMKCLFMSGYPADHLSDKYMFN